MSVFDINVLVYAMADGAPQRDLAQTALDTLVAAGSIRVTRQMLLGYLSATTRPQSGSIARTWADAVRDANAFSNRFEVLDDGPLVWAELIALGPRVAFGGKQVHDANIVATMLAHGETRLLTFNGADFRRFGAVVEVVTP